MKVTVDEFKDAYDIFVDDWCKTLDSTTNKWALGAAMEVKWFDTVLPWLSSRLVDGLVDTDIIRSICNAGCRRGDNVLNLYFDVGLLKYVGVKPFDSNIRKADFDKFFDQTLPSVVHRNGGQ